MPYKDPEIRRLKAAAYSHSSYLRNKDQVLARGTVRKLDVMARLRLFKESSPCCDCETSYPYYVMDFDHRDPSEKRGNLHRMKLVRTWAVIEKEIAKCDLVCANCHRDRTQRQLGALTLPNSRRRPSDLIKALKERTPCADCKKKYPYYVMDFDHRAGVNKLCNIGCKKNDITRSALLEEISKCDIVCANCHRIRTFLAANPS